MAVGGRTCAGAPVRRKAMALCEMTMRYLLLLFLISTEVVAEYEFEKSKYVEGATCKEMVGVWFTDVTVQNQEDGLHRFITRLDRDIDGSAKLKGLSINFSTGKTNPWEFASTWSCKNDWYVEKNQWGYTAFRIKSFGASQVTLIDELRNLGGESAMAIQEVKSLNLQEKIFQNANVREFFGL